MYVDDEEYLLEICAGHEPLQLERERLLEYYERYVAPFEADELASLVLVSEEPLQTDKN